MSFTLVHGMSAWGWWEVTSGHGLVQLPCPKHSQHRLHRASRVSSISRHGGSTAPLYTVFQGLPVLMAQWVFLLFLTVTSCNSFCAHGLCIFVRHCWEWHSPNQLHPCSTLGRIGRQMGVRWERQNLDGPSPFCAHPIHQFSTNMGSQPSEGI